MAFRHLIFSVGKDPFRVSRDGIKIWDPYFPEDFIAQNTEAVSGACFFNNEASRFKEGCEDDELHRPDAVRRGKFLVLPGLALLSKHELSRLFSWSVDAHFNVLYQTSDWNFTVSLIRLFPYQSVIGSIPDRWLTQEDQSDVFALLDTLPPDTCLFGFSHDAMDMVIFGNLPLLERIRDAHHEWLKSQGFWP